MRMHWLPKLFYVLTAGLVSLAIANTAVQAQTPDIGGPYTTDENTMLLMHFNDTLENVSDSSANGVGHGKFSYVDNSQLGLGKALRLDNDARSDSSYITVPDTSSLDMTQSWTIEGWFNIFTFGEGSDDWRWVPRIIVKPGDDVFYTGNYYMEMWGSTRYFKAGYRTEAGDGDWIEVDSPQGMLEAGSWYHWAYIRDAENNVLISVIHDSQGNMKFFGVNPYDPISESPPLTSDRDLHIGFGGGGDDSWLDGFVDEIRISNKVRSYDIPPVFTSTTDIPNQQPGNDYNVSAKVYKLGDGSVESVKVHYRVDEPGAEWQTVNMSSTGNLGYEGTIPEANTGETVEYYYSATDNAGRTATIPNNAESDSVYRSFGIFEPGTQTLSLSFESGSGAPVDSSMYGNEPEVFGDPTYSEDAMEGQYSMFFEGDSSALEFNSPFLKSDSMQVDLWFKADSMPSANTRLIANSADPWWNTNFQINFASSGAIGGGSYMPNREGESYLVNIMRLDSTIQEDKWYKATYQMTSDTAYFVLRNSEGDVVDLSKVNVSGISPITQGGPLTIGNAGGSGQPYFHGYVDGVRIYNYPKDDFSTLSTAPDTGGVEAEPRTQTLSMDFESGSGVPVDHSQYGLEAELWGDPSYSDDAMAGDYSMYFEGDSSALRIDSNMLMGDSLQVSLWFKADSLPEANTRLIGKQGQATWYQQNYEIKFLENGGLSAGSYMPTHSTPYIIDDMVLDSTITAGTWYKAIYQLTPDTAYFVLQDANEQRIDVVKKDVSGSSPQLSEGPFALANAGGEGQPFFNGWVDNVKVYNYPEMDISSTSTDIGDEISEVPDRIQLKQNYPNPFNPTTNIAFSLPTSERVSLKVYDMLGREVASLISNEQLGAGQHRVTFDAGHLSSGMYMYRLQVGNQSFTRKMLLVK